MTRPRWTGVAAPWSSPRRTVSSDATSTRSSKTDTDLATIYGPEKLERLVAVKRAWDPENAFRSNHNIRP